MELGYFAHHLKVEADKLSRGSAKQSAIERYELVDSLRERIAS